MPMIIIIMQHFLPKNQDVVSLYACFFKTLMRHLIVFFLALCLKY